MIVSIYWMACFMTGNWENEHNYVTFSIISKYLPTESVLPFKQKRLFI